jgi:putative SOS response-associated peptidase YedK
VCGRYTLATPDPGELRARFPIGDEVEVRRRFNVAPGDEVLAVTSDRVGRPRGELLRWGLVPSWSGGPDSRQKMINARVETVTERPAYRRAFERFRCLILADGFYEWDRGKAFHITQTDGAPFAFAGLWAVWRGDGDDAPVRSCTIITAAANAAVARLHDRMPVILRPEAERAWLDPSTSAERLLELLAPLPSAQTRLRPVGPAVNDARYDGRECLAPPVQAPTLF